MQEENINMTEKSGLGDKITLPLSIIIAGLLIGGGIYLNGKMDKDTSSNSPTEQARQGKTEESSLAIKQSIRPIDANDHFIGNSKARVVLVEYSDTECPFCRTFHKTMQTLMQEYGKDGKLAWVYRHFPIAELHSKAPKEAEALECAGELGGNSKFWEYTNKLYDETPSNNGLEESKLSKIALDVGLDTKKFNLCIESSEFAPRVESDVVNAKELGGLGTPYSILIDTKNNEYYPIEGAFPYSDLKNIIDMILSN